jgi:hypothetical protein
VKHYIVYIKSSCELRIIKGDIYMGISFPATSFVAKKKKK